MSVSDSEYNMLCEEFASGNSRICVCDLSLILGKKHPYLFKGVVVGFVPKEEIKKSKSLIESIITKLKKKDMITPMKLDGEMLVRIVDVTYTHITNGYKKK